MDDAENDEDVDVFLNIIISAQKKTAFIIAVQYHRWSVSHKRTYFTEVSNFAGKVSIC